MTPLDFLIAALAAFAAGAINALAGGGTLITFPVLTALGLPAVTANITSTVSLFPGYFGATWAQRKDLNGQEKRMRFLLPAAALGGLIGGLLLLQSGEKVFKQLVPFLILFASLLVVVIGGILTVFLGRRLSKPIHDLMDATRALDAGQYHFRFAERRHDEIGNLMTSFNRFAESMQRTTEMESTLSRYLSPSVAREIITGGAPLQLGGQRVTASVLFADIVGFTGMAEGMSPEEVAGLLNRYFAHIVRACEMHQGMVDKYIGDCAMLVFGVPQSDPEHSFHAIACALTVLRLVAMENQLRDRQGQAPVRFRLGLNSGEMLAGNMGSQERMEYTVVGDAVNLASRLSAAAEGGQVVITEQVYRQPEVCERFKARPHRSIRLRGIQHPVMTYIIEDMMPPYKEAFERQIQQLWWQGRRRTA